MIVFGGFDGVHQNDVWMLTEANGVPVPESGGALFIFSVSFLAVVRGGRVLGGRTGAGVR
jgi:hypothetical protein